MFAGEVVPEVLSAGKFWSKCSLAFSSFLLIQAILPGGQVIAPLLESLALFCIAHTHAHSGISRTTPYRIFITFTLLAGLGLDSLARIAATYDQSASLMERQAAGILGLSYATLALSAIVHAFVPSSTGAGWRRLTALPFLIGGFGHIVLAIAHTRVHASTATILADSSLACGMLILAIAANITPDSIP